MPTPGQIATDMQQALRDLEAALHRMSAALGLAPYQEPKLRHPDRSYVDMVRTRALADWMNDAVAVLEDWLNNAVDALEDFKPETKNAVVRVLEPLTKAQLLALASDLGADGLSDNQRKDELIAALVAFVTESDDEPTDTEPDAEPDDAEES